MTDFSTALSHLSPEQRNLFLLRLNERSRRQAAPVFRIGPRPPGASPLPLSFAQERLWFLDQWQPGNVAYGLPVAIRLEGPLDVLALARAADEMVRRHEALRTAFRVEGGRCVQVVGPAGLLPLPLVDLGELAAAERQEEALRLVRHESVLPFDLGLGPLIRGFLVRHEPTEHWALVTMHHIISDAWSMGIFLRELGALYQAFSAGLPSPLAEPAIQYADYALWQREWLAGEVLESQIGHWRERLAGAPMLELPIDRPRLGVKSFRGRRQTVLLPPRLQDAVRALGQQDGATVFMTLAAAFNTLLHRYSGQGDVVVGTPIAGRNRSETEPVIGFFVNTLVLRNDLSGDPSFGALMARVRQATWEAYAHQDLPFEKLVEALRPERDPSQEPFFQVMVALQNAPLGTLRLPGLTMTELEVESSTAKFDLSLVFVENEQGLACQWWYSLDVLDGPTVSRMAGHFRTLLEAVVVGPERRLSELPLLTPPERQELLVEWNDPRGDYPAGDLLHELVAARVARQPEAVALVSPEGCLSYGELAVRAQRLARHLRALGIGPEMRVGICAERSLAMVVGLLAILQAGGAYAPLDPSYPPERLAAMVADSGIEVLLIDERHAAAIPARPAGTARRVWLGALPRELAGGMPTHPAAPASAVLPEHPAYLIYTSGSTGQPKGVLVSHRAVTNRLRFHAATDLDSGSRVMQKTTISFDVSLLEIFGPLLAGGVSVLARPGGQQEASYLLRLAADEEVTHLTFPPSLLSVLLEQEDFNRCRSLEIVVTGSEAVPADLPRRFHARMKAKLYNRYGPTEAAIAVTSWRCDPGGADRTLPIGRPIARAEIYLVDPALHPVPAGVTGELLAGGICLARGYLNQPGLTAEKFIPHPFGGRSGARLYRTGDLARYRADGAIEFVGRIDQQVKIRGFRVELGEIEAALLDDPAIAEAVVAAPEDGASRRLVAYVVPAGERVPSEEELRRSLQSRLPEYMLPAAFVVLDRFPLAPTGKVDRRALPAPEWRSKADFVAPRTPVEELLAGVWAEVLGRERVGVEHDFFELGGHSLLAIQAISRLRQTFAVEIPLQALFEFPTVESMARRVRAALLAGQAPATAPLRPAARGGDLPLSFAQERLWFLDQLQPGNVAYNMPGCVRLRGRLEVWALAAALSRLARRHESLRTTFAARRGRPVQRIQAVGDLPLPVVDLSGPPAAAREAEVRRLATEEARRPFDLAVGPLVRCALLRLAPGSDEVGAARDEEHAVLFDMHHIISDGWSMGVFLRELTALYEACRRGLPSPLPKLEVQYADFAVWQREWLVGEALESQLAYWKERLAGAPMVLELPGDRPRQPLQRARDGSFIAALPADLATAIGGLCRREGVTLFMALLAGFQAVLHRYTGQDTLLVGSPIANRTRRELEPLIGFFVNTLVLRSDVIGAPLFRDQLGRVRSEVLAASSHQDLPFERLVEELAPPRDLSRSPLVQVVFQAQNAPLSLFELPGLTLEPLPIEGGAAKFDLVADLVEGERGLAGSWSFNAGLFDRSTVVRLAGHFATLLAAAAAHTAIPLSELPLLSGPERSQLLVEWNDTGRDYPREACVHELVAEQAAFAPEAAAVIFGNAVLTYGELDRRANRLAHALRALGVGADDLVAFAVPRSLAAAVGLLAILKAGGAYLSLDLSSPRERLAFQLRDAGARVLLTHQGALVLPEVAVVLDLEHDAEWIAGQSMASPPSVTVADNRVYVDYTSGSTGVPKGVEVVHRAVVRLVRETGYARFGPREVFLQLAPISFDASTLEVWGALVNGGRLVMMPPAAPSLAELGSALSRHGVSLLWLTAGLFHQMVESNLAGLAAVRQLLAGGDALSPAHVGLVLARLPGTRLINGYGPTEGTTFTCCWTAEPQRLGSSVPIGRPIANTRAYVLEGEDRPAPVGVAGELAIAGDGLARGYLGRPELTAERFRPDPFSARAGERIYRTGDLVRWLGTGQIEFLGRIDRQVKVRGFRIEPGEIEAALAEHPAVAEAAVLVREDRPGDRRVVACVVPREGQADPDPGDLRAFLARRLPEYMLPSAFINLPALPLTANGKVDRRALAMLTLAKPREGRSNVVAPRTRFEERLVGIWSEVLGLDRQAVGVHDSFFDLGGHSLLATQAISRIREVFGVDLRLARLFETPTVAALAREVEGAWTAGGSLEERPILPAPAGRELPLSFAQERLWFLEQLAPGNPVYNLPEAFRLTGRLDLAALAASLAEIVRRHAALRTTFPLVAGRPVQAIAPHLDPGMNLVDLSGLPDPLRGVRVQRLAEESASRSFDLARGPLLRAMVLRVASREHVVLLNLHHVVSDGWSVGVLVRELEALYPACLERRPSPLPELAIQYADFAVWQRDWLQGEVLESQLAYWRETLRHLPPFALPTDRPRPPVRSPRGNIWSTVLPADLSARLGELARAEGVTLFMILLAAMASLLSRYADQEDIAIGSPVANRNRTQIEGLIGFFVNVLVLRADCSGNPAFQTLLARVASRVVAAFAHQDLPFEKVVEAVEEKRDPSRTPLFQVLLALQNATSRTLDLPGLLWAPVEVKWETAKFDLTVNLRETPGGLAISWVYSRDLFDRTTIKRLAGHFHNLLAGALDEPAGRLAELPLLSEAERCHLLSEWNDSATRYPRELCVHELFAVAAARSPEAAAVAFEGEVLTYGELDRSANRLAHYLRALGAQPDEPVAISVERSAVAVVGLLGILKAGGAYVPLDPSYPAERLSFMLRDSGARLLLTGGVIPEFEGEVTVVDLELDRMAIAVRSAEEPETWTGPLNLAYLTYTSGSTGTPKGVSIPHRTVARLLFSTDYLELTAADRVAQIANLSFDAVTFEIWGPLLHGGLLVGVSRDVALSPGALVERLRAADVSALFLTTALFNQVARDTPDGFLGVGSVLFGGEAVDPRWVREVLAAGAPGRLLHVYGPTESTTYSSWQKVEEVVPEDVTVPIGRPLVNTRLHVLAPQLEPVPIGVPGELYIGGEGLARCYWDRPELTAERFIPDPCSGEQGARLYRTGDLVRHRPGGEIDFLGRADHQVKIRGFRIEPGEIESVLLGYPGVRECAVLVREGTESGDRRLIAYVGTGSGPAPAANDLADFLRRSLPDHMVPSGYVVLFALPLTPNGKIDREELARHAPAPEMRRNADHTPPANPTEELLAGIWRELLDVEWVGRHDDFFELGGHSLLATQVVSRARQTFGVELPLDRLFERPTVAGLAEEIAVAIAGRSLVAPPILPVRHDVPLPLSFAQQRLWFIDQLEPGSPGYNVATAFRAIGPLAPATLTQTLAEVVRRHESLRTVFQAGERGGPVQVIREAGSVGLPWIDLSALGAAERGSEVERLTHEEARMSFDLAEGPLLRATLLVASPEEHVLLFTFHHIVGDAWSTGVLVHEVSALYEAFRQGLPSPLPELPVQYADFAVWQRQWLSGEVLERELAYWRERLAGAPPVLELPTDRPRPAAQTFRGSSEPLGITSELTADLRAFSRRQGVTLFMTVLGAFQTLLSRYSGQLDFSLGMPVAGRNRLETEGLIGFFVNSVVLRGDLSGAPGFAGLLARVRPLVLQAYAHQDLPFEMLVEDLQPARSLSHEPLFQVVVNFPTMPVGEMALSGLTWQSLSVKPDMTHFDLILTGVEDAERLGGQLEYRTDLFDGATMRRMLGHLYTLLSGIVSDPECAIGDLPLLTPEELQQLAAEQARVERFTTGPCLHRRFEEQARRSPGSPALVLGVESLTYGQLDRRANRLAHRLRRLGVGPEIVVGVCLERSLDLVVAILGVQKAGGAYLPLDPAYPKERLDFLLTDAGAPVIVTRGTMAVLAGSAARLVSLDDAGLETEDDGPVESGVTPENLAYVIYTSGSTGRPRGVLVSHGNVGRLLAATERCFGFGPSDVWTLFHSFAFDFSVWEIWGALAYGGSLVVVPYWVSRSPEAFYDLLIQEGVTVLNQTPSAFRQLMRAEAAAGGGEGLSLRLVIFGGEGLEIQSLQPWVSRHGALCPLLVNMYGITETTVHVTYRPLTESDVRGGGGSVIGGAIPDLGLAVLDPGLAPQPVGVPGELCISGPGLARGYLGRPELTAERFVPDPWAAAPGARLYRSGDLVRRLADEDLEYLGRLDHQVKVRGFRIELGEIESALAGELGVREVVVIVREDEPGDRRLVAYVVGGPGESPDPDVLRAALKRKLPEPLLPSAIVALESLPLTVNGKVDRAALPAPETRRVEVESSGRQVATPVEEVLCGIWEEVLRLERVGVEKNFFELGGHSLLATQVASRVRQALDVELPLRLLFENPTVGALAAEIERSLRGGERAEAPPILPVRRGGELPVSFAQRRMWFLDQLAPGSPAYNMPAAFRLNGRLDRGAFAASLAEIVRRHETLRTTFATVGGRPVPVIALAPDSIPVPLIDLAVLPDVSREKEEGRLAGEDSRRPFDLRRGPLFRAALLRLAGERHAALFNLHHIASDGWSTGVLVGELGALYPAFVDGRPSPLPELPVQYSDFAVWQNGWLSGEVLEGELAYWRQALAGLQTLDLSTDRPRPSVGTSRGGLRSFLLSRELSSALAQLSRAEGTTLFMNLLAGFATLLARYTGQDDVAVGSAIANRTHREIEGLIGFFVNTLVLRVSGLSGRPSFRELLGRVRSTALGAFAHQDLPFERLVEELQPERDMSRTPLFEVMFILQNVPGGALELPGLHLAPLPFVAGTANFDLNLALAQTESGLAGSLTYKHDLFDATTIDRMAGHLATLLAGAVADPEACLADLPLLTGPERQALLEWNGTATDSSAACLHPLIAAQARRTPDATAVTFEAATLTYGELDARAACLARQLRRLGVGPEKVVGICVERSLDLMVGLLGVLQAGGAYLPLDPSYPRERLVRMLEDARPAALLIQARTAASLPEEGSPRIFLDSPWASAIEVLPWPEERPATPDNLAYVIFTSGSTGRPKGAMNSHRGIVNRLLWMQEAYGLTAADRVLQKTPISFDVSVWELFCPLLTGACLVVARPGEHQEPGRLARTITAESVTLLHFVPAMLQAFLEEPAAGGCTSVRQVVASGEALPLALQERFFERLPGAALHNLYGPTEAAVEVTAWTCAPGASVVPIGRPLPNTSILLLDGELRPVPVGIPGELHIGGVQVARGYRGRPDLTAERFIPDPEGEAGARLYRTGDLARHLPGGEVEYLGRIDHQVKIRGIRIELGEIEAALATHPVVREAVVLVRGEGSDRRLVGYLTVAGEAVPTPPELRAFLGSVLPEQMIPAAFMTLDALPLMPNGKVDRGALARLAPALDRTGGAAAALPRSPVEEMVAGIWADVLGLDRVEVGEDFFALGGHSLLATQMMSRVRAACSVELPLRVLFEQPTVAGFAREIEGARRVDPLPPIARVPRDRDLPLSFAQQRLWFLDRLEPERGLYNIPLAARLSGALSVAALAASCNEIVRRHEALRTHFALRPEGPVQEIAPQLDVSPALADLGALPEGARPAELARLAAAEAERPFDLGRGPLVRATLLRLDRAGDEHAFFLTLHHTVTDGWSTGILLRELSALYGGRLVGRPVDLPPLPIQYADFAVWQRHWLAGEVLASQLAFWRQRLAAVPALLDLPTDRPRPTIQTFRGGVESLLLPAELTASVQRMAVREGVTLFMLLLAAFDVLLARHAGQEDVVVGTPVANRTRMETEGLIGFFVNTLVLRTDLAGEPTFGELLGRVREMALAAYAHQDVPFERLVEELAPDRSLGRTPLFQVMFAVDGGAPPALELPGLAVTGLDRGAREEAKFDLGFGASPRSSGHQLSLTYNSDLFDGVRVRRMLDHFARLLAAAVADPGARWQELPLIGEGERQQVLFDWNATSRPRGPISLVERFESWAVATPDGVAVLAGDQQVTYGELASRAHFLARRLQDLGVGPEVRVGILAEPSVARVVAVLAVLTAGGAFLPLDPDHPVGRTARILDDAAVPILLTDSGRLESLPPLPAGTTVLPLGTPGEEAGEGAPAPSPGSDPNALAYVIYTSGSTGVPNGVLVRQGSVANLILTAREAYGVLPGDRVSHFVSFGFDAAVLEMFLALASGASLVIGDDGERLPGPGLLALLRRQEVVHLVMTPSVLALLPDGDLPALRTVSVGGESCPPELASRWSPRVQLLNCYGPTETAIFSTSFVCRGSFAEEPPIGQPVANTAAYLLDPYLWPVPLSAPGELFLGGEGLARGYLGRPDLTAARFLPNPFGGRPGSRLYRTGDLSRYRADGNLEFLGRIDSQVKVRGLRIELGEVEATLREHPGVLAVAVVAVGAPGSDRRLVAYVVPREGESDPPELERGLRQLLGARLPAYMTPSAFVTLDEMPLTPTGKLDRRALPAPSADRQGNAGRFVAPRDQEELELARIWEELLGISPIGVRDSFFDLGGYSLLAVRLMARVAQRFGRELPLSSLFEAPTVERMASLLRGTTRGAAATWSPLVPLATGGPLPPFFCVHPVGGSVFCYQELARDLALERPFYALEARGLTPGAIPHARIEEMAADYLTAIRTVQESGPYSLGGWSFGGLVALEIARQLAAQGEPVAHLALIDPTTVTASPPDLDDSTTLLLLVRDLGGITGKPLALAAAELAGLDADEGLERVLERLREAGGLPADADLARVRSLLRLYRTNVEAALSYTVQACGGRITLFRPTEGGTEESTKIWRDVARGGLDVHDIAGNHYTMLREPHVAELRRALRACLAFETK